MALSPFIIIEYDRRSDAVMLKTVWLKVGGNPVIIYWVGFFFLWFPEMHASGVSGLDGCGVPEMQPPLVLLTWKSALWLAATRKSSGDPSGLDRCACAPTLIRPAVPAGGTGTAHLRLGFSTAHTMQRHNDSEVYLRSPCVITLFSLVSTPPPPELVLLGARCGVGAGTDEGHHMALFYPRLCRNSVNPAHFNGTFSTSRTPVPLGSSRVRNSPHAGGDSSPTSPRAFESTTPECRTPTAFYPLCPCAAWFPTLELIGFTGSGCHYFFGSNFFFAALLSTHYNHYRLRKHFTPPYTRTPAEFGRILRHWYPSLNLWLHD